MSAPSGGPRRLTGRERLAMARYGLYIGVGGLGVLWGLSHIPRRKR